MSAKSKSKNKENMKTVLKQAERVLLGNREIEAIVEECGNGRRDCDLAQLRMDINCALEALKDNGAIAQVKSLKKNLLIHLDKIEDTKLLRWLMSAVARNYANLLKSEGARSQDMTRYDALMALTDYSYDAFIKAKIEHFFALKRFLSEFSSDPAIELRMFELLAPLELNHFIGVNLPGIFEKHFHAKATNSPQSASNQFIQSVLRAAEITDPDADLMDLLVRRRSRWKEDGPLTEAAGTLTEED